ncbi:hypothetical protein ABIE27_001031 [Paenibacillus sp. 4624]
MLLSRKLKVLKIMIPNTDIITGNIHFPYKFQFISLKKSHPLTKILNPFTKTVISFPKGYVNNTLYVPENTIFNNDWIAVRIETKTESCLYTTLLQLRLFQSSSFHKKDDYRSNTEYRTVYSAPSIHFPAAKSRPFTTTRSL